MRTIMKERFRRPAWYEPLVVVAATVLFAPEDVPWFFVLGGLIVATFFFLQSLKLPSLLEGEHFVACKSVHRILKHKIDNQGRVRLGIFRFWLLQSPLLNWLFGTVSVGTIYITNQRFIFERVRFIINKGESVSLKIREIKEIHQPKFIGGLNIEDEIVRLSKGRLSPEASETLVDLADLIPNVSFLLLPLTTIPRLFFLTFRTLGFGLSVVADGKDTYLFWLRKPTWVLETMKSSKLIE